jgi:hypothetical protein
MDKAELISQTKLAFDFVQKLYFEVSYLIKEVEGQLAQEEEEFVIGRSGGYSISTRNSTGLEPALVNLWIYKKLAVLFVPKQSTILHQGLTITSFNKNSKVLYMRIILDDKDQPEPKIYTGVLYDFVKKGKKFPEKVERVTAHIENNETKIFLGAGDIHYEDSYVAFKGNLLSVNLFDIRNSQDIAEKLIMPALKLFREVYNEVDVSLITKMV